VIIQSDPKEFSKEGFSRYDGTVTPSVGLIDDFGIEFCLKLSPVLSS
jgi:hypothetical protein